MSRKQDKDEPRSPQEERSETDPLAALRLVDGGRFGASGMPGSADNEPLEAESDRAEPAAAEAPAREPRTQPQRPRNSRPKIKGNRGVDTLLRNAYRAQLDMLALAATKANIMISLNGLLMSMLVLSGTHFLSIDILYAIPIVCFLSGCALATVFAVLAARPDVSQQTFGFTDFERDEARLLVFEEFSDLNEDEYIEAMTRMLSSPRRVYRSMVAHVHELGSTADRKYKQLYYSYTVFMIGFVLAACSLVVVQALKWTGVLV